VAELLMGHRLKPEVARKWAAESPILRIQLLGLGERLQSLLVLPGAVLGHAKRIEHTTVIALQLGPAQGLAVTLGQTLR
jgi:hypothetical protein